MSYWICSCGSDWFCDILLVYICSDTVFYHMTHTITDNNNSPSTIPTTSCTTSSDISRMLPETQEYILNKLPPTDVLVIDSLMENASHFSHFSLKQAIDLAKTLKPKRTFIVGMNCDGFRPHDEMNEELKKVEGLEHVQFAHDGLTIEVP